MRRVWIKSVEFIIIAILCKQVAVVAATTSSIITPPLPPPPPVVLLLLLLLLLLSLLLPPLPTSTGSDATFRTSKLIGVARNVARQS